MAAYAATVTSSFISPVKVDPVVGIRMFTGKCDITNYNQTLAEITGITGKFQSLFQVIVTGISDNGYLVRWDASGNAFKAYYPTNTAAAHTHSIAVTAGTTGDAVTNNAGVLESTGGQDLTSESGGAITAAAASEVASDVDVGVVEFIAVGI
jgi:hypothetical protein